MAEGHEERVELLDALLAAQYLALRDTFAKLPVPVLLPDFAAIRAGASIENSVLHAATIVWDLPVSSMLAAALHGASMHWLAATDLVMAFAHTGAEHRGQGAEYLLDNVEEELQIALAILIVEEGGRE